MVMGTTMEIPGGRVKLKCGGWILSPVGLPLRHAGY